MSEKCVFVKVWNVRGGELMVAACDCGLIGKRLKEGKLALDVSEEFYGGDLMTREGAADVLRTATIANMVGAEAVKCGIEAGIVHEEGIMTIGGVPHAQFVCL
ncbi:MAG TPA: DUF424 family protein [Candidatus Methanomethylicus sp.]|nr:DUF424 family protein [Candidatus Methanomethylicus sp.]